MNVTRVPEHPDVQRASPAVRVSVMGVVVVLSLSLLARIFRGVDLHATLGAVARSGRLAPLALFPFVFAMTLDAVGVSLVLRALGYTVPLTRLLPIRIATEALHLTAPAGFVVADTATAALLDSQCGVPIGSGALLAVGRKWLVMRAHGLYILLGASVGAAALTTVSGRLFGGRWLLGVVAASALVPLTLSAILGAGFGERSILTRLESVLGRSSLRVVREKVGQWRSYAVAGDRQLARLGAAPRCTWTASASYFACWMVESLETCLILWLVGAPLGLAHAMAAEVTLTLLRSVGNVAPAGLGVQEAGYGTYLTAAGVDVETTAAFLLLKRGKELVWIVIGYGLLAGMSRSRFDWSRGVVARTLAKA